MPPRILATFLGGFTLLNMVGARFARDFDATIWWIDLGPFPEVLGKILLAIAAVGWLVYGLNKSLPKQSRPILIGTTGALLATVVVNVCTFYWLLTRGTIHTGVPVPLSLLIAAVLGVILFGICKTDEAAARPPLKPLIVAGSCIACLLIFALAQMFCFGKTDYTRPADAAVVFGARTYADGQPSMALADRVRTACDLYKAGVVPKLIFSGGPGDGAVPEVEAMRTMALKLGVLGKDIVLDYGGVNTQTTVKDVGPILDQMHARRVLAISHFYHLPRVKMCFQRGHREVFTVPARESYTLTQMPFNIARETVAFWAYYLRPLIPA